MRIDRECRWEGDDHMLGIDMAVGRLNAQRRAERGLDGGDRSGWGGETEDAVGELAGQRVGDAGCAVGEAVGRDVDRVSLQSLRAVGRVVVERIAVEVVGVGLDSELVDQCCDVLLAGPAPRCTEIESIAGVIGV